MRKLFVAGILLLLTNAALANYECKGAVKYIGLGDSLYVNIGFGIHKLCTLAGDTSDQCNAWFALFLSAQAQGKDVGVSYRDSTGKISSDETCSAIGHWVVPSDEVYFVNLYM
ncbi:MULTISPECIES: hypothetical protein [unclassified Oleiphilus]|uniref:hypothetical protein n=1 Tax=unclassified Oleiphilus TaxID=2631174 RepID=UPI0007C31C87|nr:MULTISPECIES: hypothetical protein [unclassified Oleiphilus]KZZ35851.1 hypothetical protein A3757_14780 [Oleiphilus sp. HI0117]KZZ51899.1 hypothetical protein A3761_19635 [Oleiphilus sp. HI0123]